MPHPRTIRVAHSPDSDDAFMFYALAEGKIDTGELRYVHELSDIESLNQRARRAELEVTAVSIHAYAYIWREYALLGSGSSMGDGYGPRLVSTPAAARRPPRGAPRPPRRRSRPPHDRVSRAPALPARLHGGGAAVRSDRGSRPRRRGGCRSPDSRGAADLRRLRTPSVGRSWRLVARGYRASAPAGRQCGAPGSGCRA